MPTINRPPKPKRRWYQFSLLTLMIVMTVATVAFGGWVQYMRLRAQENREKVAAVEEAEAAIAKAGGWVRRSEGRPQTWLESQFDDPGRPDGPAGTLGVTSVDFSYLEAIDGDIENFRPGKNSKVTDADLKRLKGLTKLEYVNLDWAKITDAGLEHLEGLTDLDSLTLSNTVVTDAGLEYLKGLTKLESLDLGGTQVTDAGLEYLKGLTNLRYLGLSDTSVTDEGVKKLQQALPKCWIWQLPLTSAPHAKPE